MGTAGGGRPTNSSINASSQALSNNTHPSSDSGDKSDKEVQQSGSKTENYKNKEPSWHCGSKTGLEAIGCTSSRNSGQKRKIPEGGQEGEKLSNSEAIDDYRCKVKCTRYERDINVPLAADLEVSSSDSEAEGMRSPQSCDVNIRPGQQLRALLTRGDDCEQVKETAENVPTEDFCQEHLNVDSDINDERDNELEEFYME